VSVEPIDLFRYSDEQVFRFNHRKLMADAERFTVVPAGIVGRRPDVQRPHWTNEHRNRPGLAGKQLRRGQRRR